MTAAHNRHAPNPGSPEAVAIGCDCPVMDNGHGRGFGGGDSPLWWISSNCALHAPTLHHNPSNTPGQQDTP